MTMLMPGPPPTSDLVDQAVTVVQEVSLEPATYVPQLLRNGIENILSAALRLPIVHRQGPTEDFFIDLSSGSAVRIMVDTRGGTRPAMYVAEYIGDGGQPNLFDRFVAVATSGSEQS